VDSCYSRHLLITRPKSFFPSGEYASLCELAAATLPSREEIVFRVVKAEASRTVETTSGADLLRSAGALAAALSARFPPQSRVILCFPAGLDFVRAFYACLFGRMIAVPLPLPGGRRPIDSVAQVAADCGAAAILGTEPVLAALRRGAEASGAPHLPLLLSAGELLAGNPAGFTPPPADCPAATIGWLQYTSGSTGSPKGVVITHANAMANAKMMFDGCALVRKPVVASWLPHYHDMGLMMAIVGPLTFQGTAVLASPLDFMVRPQLWLEMISAWRATTTAVPNFALEHCVAKCPVGAPGWDLSCLSTLVVGAEPVRKRALDGFLAAYGPSGLRPGALMPGYGLAESTLYVSSGSGPEDWPGEVTCGVPLADQVTALVVDPATRSPAPAGTEGEVWLRGPSIAAGYWGRTDDPSFGARLSDPSDPREFFRTGDLAILRPRGLVITARLKDLLIVRGVNVSPYDLEETIMGATAGIAPGAAAVFQDASDRVVAVVEVPKGTVPEPAHAEAIRLQVAADHEVELSRVVFVRRNTLPRTSSGKVQRKLTAQALSAGDLPVLLEQPLGGTGGDVAAEPLLVGGWDALDGDTPLAQFGLDSLRTAELVEKLNREYRQDVSLTEFYELKTVASVRERFRRGSAAEPGFVPQGPAAGGTSWVASGIGLRLGDARSPLGFWRSLASRESFFSERDGWTAAWTKGIFRFDPKYFKISAREAALMDPQQRWLLSATVEALRDAQLDPAALKGRPVGVFIGLSTSDFYRVLDIDLPRAGTGIAHCLAANRISHFFDWTGPSQVVDCACSSSLVALDSAMKALRDGSCEAAIVGGANFIFSHDLFRSFQQAGMLSPDRTCRPFDLQASGYVRGEGCGVVLIESAGALRREGRTGYGTIRGTAVRHNGHSQSLTAPNGESQRLTILEALSRAGAHPAQVEYVEAHGTGTPLGDSIELRSLRRALANDRDDPLQVGSIKSLYGHLEAAAGITGLIKTLLICDRGETTPQAAWTDFTPAMREVLGPVSGIVLPPEPRPLRTGPAVLGVSSFGFGGTNAHAVVGPRPAEVGAHGLGPEAPGLWNESCYAPEMAEISATMAIKRENDWG
jgi:iturin family lipopeptide synthetase A